MKWTETELNFILNNYAKLGSKKCCSILNKTRSQMDYKCKQLNLIYEPISVNSFINVSEETAYILGLLWADGSINKNTIFIENNFEDLTELKFIFDKLGTWCEYIRVRSPWKNTLTLYASNKKIQEFLIKNDYNLKSTVSPNKIINHIPDSLKYLFFLGLSDGDGCFYQNKKNSTNQFTISSTQKQDWSYMINLANQLNIKYSISITSNGSAFRITKKEHVIKIGDYLYQSYKANNIGLKRKYDKFTLIKSA